MKIVHLITSLKIGGAESLLYNLLARVDRTKHEHVVIYFHEGPNADKIKDLGFTMHQVGGLFSPYDPVGLIELVHIIRKERPDIIHSSLWSANILGQLISWILRIPIISDLHNNFNKQGWFRNTIQSLTARIPHEYIAVTAAVKESFYQAVAPEKKLKAPINIIFNGIDIEKLKADSLAFPVSRDRLGLMPYDFVIGTVGRLTEVKGQDILIESFSCLVKEAPAARLCIVGDGPQRRYLEDLARTLNVSHLVFFMGEYSNPAPFYTLFNCFALPSLSEGMSVALLEALAMGLPIITTSPAEKHEVITDGVNGFVIRPGNRQMLVDSILKLYSRSEFREVMRKQNVNLARRNFNIHGTVFEYEKLYRTFEKTNLNPKNNETL